MDKKQVVHVINNRIPDTNGVSNKIVSSQVVNQVDYQFKHNLGEVEHDYIHPDHVLVHSNPLQVIHPVVHQVVHPVVHQVVHPVVHEVVHPVVHQVLPTYYGANYQRPIVVNDQGQQIITPTNHPYLPHTLDAHNYLQQPLLLQQQQAHLHNYQQIIDQNQQLNNIQYSRRFKTKNNVKAKLHKKL